MTKNQTRNEKKNQKISSGRGVFWAVFFVLLVIVSVVCLTMIFDQDKSRNRVEALSVSIDEQLIQAQRENEAVKAEKNRLNTKEYIEAYARDKLGMVKEGEIIFKVD